jgi:hypothetical protein
VTAMATGDATSGAGALVNVAPRWL